MQRHLLFLFFLLVSMRTMQAQMAFHQIMSAPYGSDQSVAMIDINNDSRLDILIGTSAGLYWSALQADGSFGEAKSLNTYCKNYAIIADIDTDGDQDILSMHHMLLNNNNGSFTQKFINNDKIVTHYADLNNDGKLDLLMKEANTTYSETLAWMVGLGNNTFGPLQEISLGIANFEGVRFAKTLDVDTDGWLDIVVSTSLTSSGSIIWYRNLDGQGFGPRQTIITQSKYPDELLLIDLDENGTQDIVYSTPSDSTMNWLTNLGNASFSTRKIIHHNYESAGSTLYTREVVLEDMDLDGRKDLVHRNLLQKLSWFKNFGNGTFGTGTEMGNIQCQDVFFGKVNDDDYPDIATMSPASGFKYWQRTGPAVTYAPAVAALQRIDRPRWVDTPDFDLDGDQDIVVYSAYDNELSLFINIDNTGEFESQKIIYSGSFSLLADVDGDQLLDVLYLSGIQVVYRKNLGNFTFGSAITVGTLPPFAGTPYSSLCVGKVNNDGIADIVFSDRGIDVIRVYRSSGANTWAIDETIEISDVGPVALGDMDNDGDDDLVVGGIGGKLAYYRNNSGNIVPNGTTIVEGPYLDENKRMNLVDLNNDGRLDILRITEEPTSSTTPDKVYVLFNLGNNTYSEISNVVTGKMTSYYIADYDLNGYKDIMAVSLGNSSGNSFSVFYNTNGVLSPSLLQFTRKAMIAVAPFNFDNDFDKDLVYVGYQLFSSGVDAIPGDVFWVENLTNPQPGVAGTLSQVQCNNNNTPANPVDDYISFNMVVNKSFLTGNYFSVTSPAGAVTPPVWLYNSATQFRLPAGSAGTGDKLITIVHQNNTSYFQEKMIIDPGSCSVSATGEATAQEWQATPNPGRGIYYIPALQGRDTEGMLTDIVGRRFLVNILNGELEISNQPAGIYYLEISDKSNQVYKTVRIVKI